MESVWEIERKYYDIRRKKVIIKEHPLFLQLEESAITFAAEHAFEKMYKPHSFLVHQGEQANEVYFIYKGLVNIYVLSEEGKPIPMKTVGEKYFVGDLGTADGKPIPGTVEAIAETYVLILSNIDFKHIMHNYPRFVLNLLHAWAQKVRYANNQRELFNSLQLKDRTLTTLKTLSAYFPNNEITLSHEELASILGASRARVTEILNEFEKTKLLQLSPRKIRLL